MDEGMNFSEGYQDRVGEYAKYSTFKSLPDLFKSVNEGTATIRTLNQEKADLTAGCNAGDPEACRPLELIGEPVPAPTTTTTAASSGDTIIVRPGTYDENIDLLGKTITLRSDLGSAVTVIRGDLTARVVTFNSGEGPDTLLDGFTITNGDGGILCSSAAPTAGGSPNCRSVRAVIDGTRPGPRERRRKPGESSSS